MTRQAIATIDITDPTGDTALLVPQGTRFLVSCESEGYTGEYARVSAAPKATAPLKPHSVMVL